MIEEIKDDSGSVSLPFGKQTVVGSLWAFLYNSCIHESSYATVSLHYTKEGAEKAMALHKEEKRKEWQRMVDTDEDKGTEFGWDKICPFGIHEDWCVQPVDVSP